MVIVGSGENATGRVRKKRDKRGSEIYCSGIWELFWDEAIYGLKDAISEFKYRGSGIRIRAILPQFKSSLFGILRNWELASFI